MARLPDHTAPPSPHNVPGCFRENTFRPRQALDEFAFASRVPIYGYYETYLGHGIVGGSIVPFEEIGRKPPSWPFHPGGENPQAAPRSESYQPVPMFDWRQLQRWNISENRLPPGSILRFKKPPYWEQHRQIIVTAVSLCLLEGLLIVALLAQLRRRQLAEATLRENEQRMSLAVDAANFGIWIRDLARNEIWASDKWRKLLGFAPLERLEFERILERLHPEDRETARHTFDGALAAGGTYDMEFRIMLPDGGMRWISSHGEVELDADGRPVLLRGASRDVTAGKQAEQETQRLRQEVAHVGRVYLMGQLASALAHEINQPLGAILRNAEAAELFLQDSSPDLDEIRAIVTDIRKDDQRAGSVIDRMRGLLKRQPLNTRALDVGEIITEVRALVHADAAARHVKLDVNVPADLPFVRGDRVHLEQVLLNLILNGMDSFDGASPDNRRIKIAAKRSAAKTVEIAVSDTGSGIPPDKVPHVFDSFFTSKASGLGMGLPISRTIIEAHGGRIWAENNNNGGGATFRFTLPVAEKATPQSS